MQTSENKIEEKIKNAGEEIFFSQTILPLAATAKQYLKHSNVFL